MRDLDDLPIRKHDAAARTPVRELSSLEAVAELWDWTVRLCDFWIGPSCSTLGTDFPARSAPAGEIGVSACSAWANGLLRAGDGGEQPEREGCGE